MPAPVPTSGPAPGQKTIMRLYALFVVSVLMMFIPHIAAAIIALLLLVAVLAAANMLRKNAREDDLLENHMIFLTRTIWISCFFALITVSAGGLYLWTQVDVSAVMPCAQSISDYVMANAQSISVYHLFTLIEPCQNNLIADNMFPLIMASALAMIPLILYLVLRLTRGIGRAAKGYRIAHPKAWF